MKMGEGAVLDFLSNYYGGLVGECDFNGMSYKVACCSACNFVWQVEILDAETMDFLYSALIPSDRSRKKQDNLSLRQREHFSNQMLAFGRLFGGGSRPVRVLDFGMGWGEWLLMARAFGYEATGVELSEERVHHARSIGLRAFTDLGPLAGEKFDVINLEQVMEHLPDPGGILQSLRDLLADGGILRIAVPDSTAELEQLRSGRYLPQKGALQPLEHINCFTGDTLVKFGRNHGLRPRDVRLPTVCFGLKDSAIATLRAAGLRRWKKTTARYFSKQAGAG